MKRDPAQHPRAGDTLVYGKWTIVVVSVASDGVHYRRFLRGEPEHEERIQAIEAWREWAPQAELDRCVLLTLCAAGPCVECADGEQIEGEVHATSTGLHCARHCPARTHDKGRKEKREAVQA